VVAQLQLVVVDSVLVETVVVTVDVVAVVDAEDQDVVATRTRRRNGSQSPSSVVS